MQLEYVSLQYIARLVYCNASAQDSFFSYLQHPHSSNLLLYIVCEIISGQKWLMSLGIHFGQIWHSAKEIEGICC